MINYQIIINDSIYGHNMYDNLDAVDRMDVVHAIENNLANLFQPLNKQPISQGTKHHNGPCKQ